MQAPLDTPPADLADAPILSREAARAIIVRRLRALDHPHDLLDGQAIATLIDHAGGSGVRLRAALAATLFLASTEDAPRIGRSLVERALLESGDIPAAQPAQAPRVSRRILAAGGALAACVLALVLLLVLPKRREASNTPAAMGDAPVLAQADQPALRPVPTDKQTEQAAPRPGEPSTTPPEPQEEAVSQAPAPALRSETPPSSPPPASSAPALPTPAVAPLPQPATNQPADDTAAALPDLPAAPPASVVLMVSPRDSAAAQRLDTLMQHLRAAGFGQITTQPSPYVRARRPVSYFFADDLPVAQRITQLLAIEAWPHLGGNSLTPRLVIPPPGLPPRQPGLIEIQLP